MANYLYNGTKLPELPEWDKAAYPYAFIYLADTGSSVGLGPHLVVADKLGYITHPATEDGEVIDDSFYLYTLGGNDLLADQAKPISFIRWDRNESAWEQAETDQLNNIYAGFRVLWTNTTLNDANGSLFLEASEPVPAFDLKGFLNILAVGLCSQARIGTKLPPAAYLAAGLRTEKREPVAYLYNGVRLPPLPEPEWDKEKYPYAIIEHAEVDSLVSGGIMARLICSTEPIEFLYPTSLFLGGQPRYKLLGDVQYYGVANHNRVWELSFSMGEPYPPLNEWVKIGEDNFDERTDVHKQALDAFPIWSNHDFIFAEGSGDRTGSIFPIESKPIPVYE